MRRNLALTILIASFALPAAVQADAAADRKAEIERKKEEARKKAEERKKAAAAAAGGSAAVGGSTAAGGSSTTTTGAGGTSSGGASTAAAGAGGAAKGGAGGTAGAAGAAAKGGAGGTGGATVKVEEKDAPLPTADIATLRKDRAERRKVTVERLRRRWGALLANQSGIDDLKQHARRVAFLQRVRVVAEAKKDAKSVEAVDELLTKEDERHGSAMNALREGALPAGTK